MAHRCATLDSLSRLRQANAINRRDNALRNEHHAARRERFLYGGEVLSHRDRSASFVVANSRFPDTSSSGQLGKRQPQQTARRAARFRREHFMHSITNFRMYNEKR